MQRSGTWRSGFFPGWHELGEGKSAAPRGRGMEVEAKIRKEGGPFFCLNSNANVVSLGCGRFMVLLERRLDLSVRCRRFL